MLPTMRAAFVLGALAGIVEFEGAIFNLFQDKKVNTEDMHTINIFNSQPKQLESISIDNYVQIFAMAKPWWPSVRATNCVLLLEKVFAKCFQSH